MKPVFQLLAILSLAFAAGAPAAQSRPDRLGAIAWLVGGWAGVGDGHSGTSSATRRAARVENGHFIRVEGRSVYPKQPKNEAGEIHSSTDFWSFDRRRNLLVMRQFDSLGFVSTYVQDRAASTGGRIVLLSEHLENVPPGWKTRYTYTYRGPNEFHELFELDMGKGLQPYVTGRFLRTES